MSYNGRIAVVTGAGKGIGRCIAQTYASEGAFVYIAEKDQITGKETDDIAKACLYLTDEGNSFINGANIIIDGGMTRKMIYE